MAIRVRFAPSPTGFVHLGSLRTALYNYLFARHNQGKIVLRIEDTDQSRYVEGAVENLINILNWAGIDFDEGPHIGGNYGPYHQSERFDLYKKHSDSLLGENYAYPCFCSAERLDQLREQQKQNEQPVMYDGHCRNITSEEAAERMQTENYVVRLKTPREGFTIVDDLIRGSVKFENTLIDDQVLLKSDGFPTYHLANVVDDHLMQINHVIRGEEWIPSTPKHVILYKAFGWQLPEFAHLPLLLNPDRSKLSKRQNDVAVEDYQQKGVLPEALINFVALLGWNKGDDQELFSKDEMIKAFTLERVNKSGAVFDLNKLFWMNGHYIRNMNESEYVAAAIRLLSKIGRDKGDKKTNRTIVLAVRNHIQVFDDLKQATDLFFNERLDYSEDAIKWIQLDSSKMIFKNMLDHIEEYSELDINDFKKMMKTVQHATGIKGKELWMPVRAAMTGLTEGPELPAVISVFGKHRVKQLLKQALEL
ncbi:MAG: glutamate--tRNA ligase [Caldithrix sp.]|nr:glutamate--tRNA ligase [Caldithrix sp.]